MGRSSLTLRTHRYLAFDAKAGLAPRANSRLADKLAEGARHAEIVLSMDRAAPKLLHRNINKAPRTEGHMPRQFRNIPTDTTRLLRFSAI